MIVFIFGFLFGLRVRPVYNISFKNKILDVSIEKYGFPMFVSTVEDVYSIGFRGKTMFEKPKMGIYIPSSVYCLHIDKDYTEYLNFRGNVSNTIKTPEGVFLGASKDLFRLFFMNKNGISAVNYDGKLLYTIKSNETPIVFPDGKLLTMGSKFILYNLEGTKLWERDNIMGGTPKVITQSLYKNVFYFILYNEISGISAGLDATGRICWLKRAGIPVAISSNGTYFLSFEKKNVVSAYQFDKSLALWKRAFPINIKSGIILNNGYCILGGKNRAYIVNNRGNPIKIIRTKFVPYKIFYKDSILSLIGKKSISVYKMKIR